MRTRTGEILGPYTQRELLEELNKRTFTPEDEIAPSHGYWISAQTLTNRELDEFTLTHTRNQTMTRSVHTSPNAYGAAELAKALAEQEELTPTPDSLPSPSHISSQPQPVRPPISGRAPKRITRLASPLGIVVAVAALAIILIISKLRTSPAPTQGSATPEAHPPAAR